MEDWLKCTKYPPIPNNQWPILVSDGVEVFHAYYVHICGKNEFRFDDDWAHRYFRVHKVTHWKNYPLPVNSNADPIYSFDGKWQVLSNFYYCPIVYEGEMYPTNEHAYQAAKATNLKDKVSIQPTHTPGMAKRLGRKIRMRDDWEDHKLAVMRDICQIKFMTNDYCKEKLLSTKNRVLVESNTWGNTFWGESNGNGYNHLGRILMSIRDEIHKKL